MEGVGRPNAWKLEVRLPALSAAMARASEWLSCRDQARGPGGGHPGDPPGGTGGVFGGDTNAAAAFCTGGGPRGAWPVN